MTYSSEEQTNTGCEGGHTPWAHQESDEDFMRCARCANRLDMTRCGCGANGHDELSKSYCPNNPLYEYRRDMA